MSKKVDSEAYVECVNPACDVTFKVRGKGNKKFCSVTCKNRVHKPRKYPDLVDVPPGTKTRFGWLWDDGGEPDMIAVHLVVSGERIPDLTFNEAMIAGDMLIRQCKQIGNTRLVSNTGGIKGYAAQDLIALRLGITDRQAKSLMSSIRVRQKKGEL